MLLKRLPAWLSPTEARLTEIPHSVGTGEITDLGLVSASGKPVELTRFKKDNGFGQFHRTSLKGEGCKQIVGENKNQRLSPGYG